MQNRTGAEEEEGLEETMVPDVEKAAGESEGAPGGVALFDCDHGETEADKNDADIFHTVIGEEAFEIVLTESESDAEDGAGNAQRHHNPGGSGGHGEPSAKADQAVDTQLDRDPREDGRDMAWRVGMSGGKPDMKREKAGFESEAK
jgi:hypothetical protein